MKLYYTSRLMSHQFRVFYEPVLSQPDSKFQVHYNPLEDELTGGGIGKTLLGLIQRREDGIFFVPETQNVGGTLVRKGSDTSQKNGTPSKEPKKLRPNSEVLEVFDVEGNHLASIELKD